MKKIFHILTLVSCILTSGCSTDLYDYDELNDRMDIFDKRLAELEDWCKETNTNINSLKALVESLIQHDVITAVTPVLSENVVTGYTITFLNGDPITLYNGLNGKDGADGEDGKDGVNGADGKDGQDGQNGMDGRTPLIGVKQDTDGLYYWTLDGEWLTDAQGTKIKAQGEKGADGANGSNGFNGIDGAPGKDGITPQLKIETDGYWYVSYDKGDTWTKLYKGVVENVTNGTDDEEGEEPTSFLKSIDSSNASYVLFNFSDGSMLKVPTWAAFEELQTQCNTMNTNLASLQTLVDALENKVYVTAVAPMSDDKGVSLGYTITLSDGQTLQVYHGKDGEKGEDGYAPEISVAQDTDGIYYWKLDGEWMQVNGEKVKAQGTDGTTGENGAAGTDGITPQLKIEDGFWHVSYDEGETWTKMSDENAVSGNNIFKSVTVNEGKIVFVMNDEAATEVVVPVYQEIGITFDMQDNVSGIAANQVIYIPYELNNATAKTKVEASSDGNYAVKVVMTDQNSGEIVVTAPAKYVDGHILVHIDSGYGYSSFHVINFYRQEMTFANGLEYTVKPEGETIAVPLTTNFDYTVNIPADAQSWIELDESRAVATRNETLTFTFSKNEDLYAGRSASVEIIPTNARTPLYYITFNQASANFWIDKSRFAAPSEGGEFVASVTSTLGLKATSDYDWIVPVVEAKEGQANGYKLTLKVSANQSGAYRTGRVMLKSDDGKQLGTVEVAQLAIETSEMNKMIITVSANQANKYTTVLPLSGTVQCEIDWGDGTPKEVVTESRPSHTYARKTDVDYYDVKISGVVTALSAYNIADTYKNSIYAVKQWGNTGLTSMNNAFKGCNNLRTIVADETEAFTNVTDFTSAFQDCIRLETLFPKLFQHASKATTFEYAFYGCTALQTIPADLFEGCGSVTTFSYTFMNTGLIEVPELLFSYSPNVTDFSYTFRYVKTLTNVPEKIFEKNLLVETFDYTFANTGLKEVPEDLFVNCTKVKTFGSVLSNCLDLVTIPEGLFRNCPDVEGFGWAFQGCENLTTVPIGIFDGNRRVTDFSFVFSSCYKHAGESPYTMIGEKKVHLYERVNYPEYFITPTSYLSAFGGGWYNLIDKDQIPEIWKN